MYRSGYEEKGKKYHDEAKEKMTQLLELAKEIYELSAKESSYCIPGDGGVTVTFGKYSNERNVLNDVASKYELKF